VDGKFGPRTRAAIRHFQHAIGAETRHADNRSERQMEAGFKPTGQPKKGPAD
jgi:hypothetical protein